MIHPNTLSRLLDISYRPENISRATGYLKSRGLFHSPKIPYTTTPASEAELLEFKDILNLSELHNRLVIPIPSLANPGKLVCINCRDLLPNSTREKYYVLKCVQERPIYTTKPPESIGPEEPLIITEGAIDAETVASLGFSAASPLHANRSPDVLVLLTSISRNLFFAYNDDKAGLEALEGMVNLSKEIHPSVVSVKKLSCPFKDLNEAFKRLGPTTLKQIISDQIKG